MRKAVVSGAVAVVFCPVAGALSGTNDANTSAEIVVSATRIETPASEVASTVTVITGEDLARRKCTTVVSALETVPGMTLVRTGGPGSPVSAFLRGGSSEHTLILIDGMEINDPTAVGRAAAMDYLDVANIERIEVLRGPQSCLYGSDAMAGVIDIVTRKGSGDPRFTLAAEGGSYNTFTETATVNGGTDAVQYSFSANRVDSDGISAAREQDGNPEADAYDATSLAGRLGVTPNDEFSLDLVARHLKSNAEFDAAGGPGGDSVGDHGADERLFLRSQATAELADSRWRQTLGLSYADHERTSESAWGNTRFEGNLWKADWKNDVFAGDRNVITAGAEFEREEAATDASPEQSAETLSAYLQDRMTLSEALSATAGGRYDRHASFGDEWTYRVAPLYTVASTRTRLKATYGTGFKAPSLYQLYAPPSAWGNVGNPNLKPETVRGLDAGIEQPFGERVTAGATWFQNWYDDLIDFEDGFVNRSEAKTRGIELTSAVRATDALTLRAAYTCTVTKDESTGKELIRRPKHQASLDALCQWNRRLDTAVRLLYVGDRSDRYYSATMFTPEDVTLDAYLLVNLSGSYRLRENLELYVRIENLLDEDYEEIAGYGTPGLSAYGGVRLTL